MPAPYEGGCQCGALRYRINAEPLTYYACHCTDCQVQSGSSFGLSMGCLLDTLELLRGSFATYTKVFEDDGREKYARFCPECGTRIWHEFSAIPGVVSLKAGTLDDPRGLRPVAHTFVRSKQEWVELPDSVLQYEEAAPDFGDMIAAWTAQNASG